MLSFAGKSRSYHRQVSRGLPVVGLIGLMLVLGACAAGPNPEVGVASDGNVAGFFLGLWHGIISPVTFIISLFTEDVSIYEVHNDGNWYDFGFVLGAGILFGGGFLGIGRSRRDWAR
jgi:hypothetical protein